MDAVTPAQRIAETLNLEDYRNKHDRIEVDSGEATLI